MTTQETTKETIKMLWNVVFDLGHSLNADPYEYNVYRVQLPEEGVHIEFTLTSLVGEDGWPESLWECSWSEEPGVVYAWHTIRGAMHLLIRHHERSTQ